MNGWFKFHRKTFENPVIMKDTDTLSVWVWLLGNAAFDEKRVLFGGAERKLNKGELVTTSKFMAGELKINESKVNRVLKTLENEKQIERQSSSRNTLICIVNWEKYQSDERQNDEQVINDRQTNDEQMTDDRQTGEEPVKDERQTSDGQVTTIQENKKEKEDKKGEKDIDTAAGFEAFWDAYPKKVRRQEAETAYCDLLLSGTVTPDELHAAALNYSEACRIEGTDKVYHPHNFLARCAFEDYLPGKYRKPKKQEDKGNQFCSFPQREQSREELAALEAVLLGRGGTG